MAYKDKAKQKAWQEQNHIKRRERNAKVIQEAKLSLGGKCIVCEEDELCCLDFHHINPDEKMFTIGETKNGYKKPQVIKEEAKKCILLCRNCHAKYHAGILTLVLTRHLRNYSS